MKERELDLVILNAAQVVTVENAENGPRRGEKQGELSVIEDGAVAIKEDRIVDVGSTGEIRARYDLEGADILDARGKIVLPGLVDCHNHPVFAGRRYDEYAERLAGASLDEVAHRGGGIWRTVVRTRAASDGELLCQAQEYLELMLESGTTTVEGKSGYGQNVPEELRELSLVGQLAERLPLKIVPTFLGAHVVPREFNDDSDGYVDLVINEMLPAVVEQGIARSCDVTCEVGYFSPEQCARILERAAAAGLRGRVHADAWRVSRGWATAVACGAASADHLTVTPDSEIDEVGPTETVAVLLPSAELVYFSERRANARKLIETGVPIAISTDFGSSIHTPCLSQLLGLSAAWFRMSPEETIVAATINPAYVLGVEHDSGSLEPGKRADLVIFDVPHYQLIVYVMTVNLVTEVVVGGRRLSTTSTHEREGALLTER